MRVLIIKLTSMGDLMHAFPALTDAAEIYPDIQFDWVVDEGFSAVPKWHPSVNEVIKTAHRRWRKHPLKNFMSGEWKAFYGQLNLSQYDFIIDLQSNLKSAFVSWLRRGSVHGYDQKTCREWPAHWAYKNHYRVDLNQHAIQRQRELFAQILDYECPATKVDYGADLSASHKPDFALPSNFLVFVHNASWSTKLWPVDCWRQLIELADSEGYSVLLPSGSEEERLRAEAIVEGYSSATALPKLPLDETAVIMSSAKAAVCSDTGLAHLSALVETPSITLYGATDTQLIGTFGDNQHHLISEVECSPCYSRKCFHKSSTNDEAFCMREFSAGHVWQKLKLLLEQPLSKS